MSRLAALLGLAMAGSSGTAAIAAQPSAQIPFVGCKSDGQMGPLTVPRGHAPRLRLDPATAARLAYYRGPEDGGVLAPRGWYCFETYGSNGANLYVSPDPDLSKGVFDAAWPVGAGPAIQLSASSGETSGRFEVAQAVARAFPAHMAFVRQVIAEGVEPASDFPVGLFPTDTVSRPGPDRLVFRTPPHRQGLGTQSRLRPSGNPIDGILIVNLKPDEDSYLVQLDVRLPPALRDLTPAIIRSAEPQATAP